MSTPPISRNKNLLCTPPRTPPEAINRNAQIPGAPIIKRTRNSEPSTLEKTDNIMKARMCNSETQISGTPTRKRIRDSEPSTLEKTDNIVKARICSSETQISGTPTRKRIRDSEPSTLEKTDNIVKARICNSENPKKTIRRSLWAELNQPSWNTGHCKPNKTNSDDQNPPGSQGALSVF